MSAEMDALLKALEQSAYEGLATNIDEAPPVNEYTKYKEDPKPKHHWCNHYRSAVLKGKGKKTKREIEHDTLMEKFCQHYNYYGKTVPRELNMPNGGYAKILLEEVGNCFGGTEKCNLVREKFAAKIARYGASLRAEFKLVPLTPGDTVYEKFASRQHVRNVTTMKVLNTWTPKEEEMMDLARMIRAKFAHRFEAAYMQTDARTYVARRTARREARAVRNATATPDNQEPDTDVETEKKNIMLCKPYPVTYFESLDEDYYDPEPYVDTPFVSTLGPGYCSGGEANSDGTPSKRQRLHG